MMTRQSMARVSSASPEADSVPVVAQFDSEATLETADARKNAKSKFSGNLERDADESPPLPFPPGRRPKDGFYLPYSRDFGVSPEGQIELDTKPRKLFNLKFPGTSKKTSRMRLPFQSSTNPSKASQADEVQGCRIFSPTSGQRFGSSITNKMLMQFQKKQTLWRRCLPSNPEPVNGSSSFMYPNRGRRLDEGFDEGFVTGSPLSGSSIPSTPRHGQCTSSNSSPVVKSSRFMASMLISLCPDDAGDSQLDAERANSDDDNEEIGIPHVTSPRTKSSSPEAFEVEMDPASQIVISQDGWTCTCRHRANAIDSFAPRRGKTSRSVSRSLHEELANAHRSPSEYARSRKFEQPTRRDTQDSLKELSDNHQQESADADPEFFCTSPNMEFLRNREASKISLAWNPRAGQNRPNQEFHADTASAQESSDSEFADGPIFDDDGEENERRGGDRRLFSTDSNRSSSPEFISLHNTIWARPNSLSNEDFATPVPKLKDAGLHSMVGYLSPPRISIEDLEYSNNSGKPKAFARWRSIPEPSTLRRNSVEPGGSERKQSHVIIKPATPLQRQSSQRTLVPSETRTRDLKQTAKSSSLRPIPGRPRNYADESGEDSECSTTSSGYETPPSVSSHMLPDFASPKSVSPRLLNLNLQSRRRNNFSVADQATTLPGPSLQQIMMARSHSVRSPSSRRYAPQESQVDTSFRGLSHPSRLAKTSSSSVMSKVALFESKAGVSKSGPLT